MAPRSKAANFNLKGILNLRDIDAILPQLRPRRLQTWAHFAELALRLFRFHWGAAATAQGPGETATVDDSVTLSVVTTARGSQATRPSGGLVKTTPCPGLCHSASRRRMESVCGSGICVWARSSRSTDFSCLFWVESHFCLPRSSPFSLHITSSLSGPRVLGLRRPFSREGC